MIKKILDKLKNIKDTNEIKTKIKSKEKIYFLDNLSSLLNSGIPLNNGLEIIYLQTKIKSLKNIIKNIKEKLNSGESLSESFSLFPSIFSQFDISLVQMGELTGNLGESIEIIKDKEEKTRELKQKVLGALIYPIVIISLATIMIFIFMIYVIPKIQDMYKDAKVNLPDLTQTIINISIFMQNHIFAIIITFLSFIFIVGFLRNYKHTKIYFDKAMLFVPIFGMLMKKKNLSLFSYSLGTLISRGVIINKALEISSKALENDYYEREIQQIITGVSAGKSISSLMGINNLGVGKKENFLFPLEFSSVINIGEQTGKLADLLLKVQIKYNKEVDNIVKNLATTIEPIVIVGVGLIIGTIIMAIMLPFFNMVNVI